MKLTVIHGTNRRESTYHCAHELIDAVRNLAKDELEVTEFFLPIDGPSFCRGCFSCFQNGEDTCPHSAQVQPIAGAIKQADIIVLTSSVYALDVTGQMKTLLDHLCYMWISHRPSPEMFRKVGVTICTTAGAGLSHTSKTLAHSLNYWGLIRVHRFSKRVAASCWAEVSDKKRGEIYKTMQRIAGKAVKGAQHEKRLQPRAFTRFFFFMMKGMMKGNTWCKRDHNHWKELGWLGGDSPF